MVQSDSATEPDGHRPAAGGPERLAGGAGVPGVCRPPPRCQRENVFWAGREYTPGGKMSNFVTSRDGRDVTILQREQLLLFVRTMNSCCANAPYGRPSSAAAATQSAAVVTSVLDVTSDIR